MWMTFSMVVSAGNVHLIKKTLPDSHREVPQHKHKIKHDKTTMHHLLYTFVNVLFIYSHTFQGFQMCRLERLNAFFVR